MRITTWNMQGGNNSKESKWTTGVTALFGKEVESDAICLQECGQPSGSITALPNLGWTGPVPGGLNYQYYRWRPYSTDYYVLWVDTEKNGGRVNLAVVTTAAPTGFLYSNPGLPGGRPAIGVTFGENVFSIHGFSGSGNDDPGLITNVNGLGLASWYVLGDYNREPTPAWTANGVICPPNAVTHPGSKKKYDYMVKSAGAAQTGYTLTSFVVSDHYPVVFDV